MKRLALLCLTGALLAWLGWRQSLAADRKNPDGGAPGVTKGRSSLHLHLSDSRQAMRFLEKSAAPLKDGQEDCTVLADSVETVGDLVKKYQRKANKQKSAVCKPKGEDMWSCEANFVYNDKRQSENDFAVVIRLEVEDATGKVVSLACFLAG